MERIKTTKIRFFTISDYEEEEIWLREQHKAGWKLTKTTLPCFYHFTACEPEDVVYRLDYRNGGEDAEYLQMFTDYGWEYFEQCMGWNYFRKSAKDMDSEKDSEIFSDDESKLEMLQRVIRTRMLPLLIIFMCCLIPQIARMGFRPIYGVGDMIVAIVLWVLFILYLWLFLHCGKKFRKLQKKYGVK